MFIKAKFLSKAEKILLLGPATIVSVAYIDPGNFGSNIAAGARYGLSLLWVVWISGLMAILFQYISGKIGIATGKSILDLIDTRINSIDNQFKASLRYLYFSPMFLMILATDMAEFLGIVLGLHLIFNIPLLLAIPISIIDVMLLMTISEGKRTFELIIVSLVSVVGISYLIELQIVGVDFYEVLKSSFTISIADQTALLIAISIIGATVMPHAVILHSYLTSENNSRYKGIKHHLKETIVYLSIASLINAALQIMAYYAFHSYDALGEVDIEMGYKTLTYLYGSNAALIFAIALLASGISSSMVSVVTGVKVVETMIKKKLRAWKLRLLVRLINMLPLAIAIIIGIKTIDVLVYSQAILSLTLPLILFPLTIASSSKRIMNEYSNSLPISILAFISALFISFLNISFLIGLY